MTSSSDLSDGGDQQRREQQPSGVDGTGLARAGARGAIWQGLAQAIGKSVVLLTTIVLARLLSPQEYGLVALALVLMVYAEAVADGGVAQALIYLKHNARSGRAALLVSVVSGSILTGAAVVCAPFIGDFFHNRDVTPLVRILAISLFAASMGAVPEALLRRDLQFRRLTIATVGKALITGIVSMGLALDGWGAWSLAIGTAAGSVGYAALCWWIIQTRVPWDLWRVRKTDIRATMNYGAPVAGSTLLARLIFDVDYLIVGRLLGAQALGFYTMAFRLPEFIILNVFFVLSTVMFPVYARARHDPAMLRRGYLQSMRIQALYGVTAGIGLAAIAPSVVPLLFGEKWLPAVLPLSLLALYAAARSLGAGANEVYKAVGRPGLSIWLSLARLAILVPVLVVASRWGIVGVAWAQLLVALLFSIGMQILAASVIKYHWRDFARAIAPAMVCGAAVAAVGLLGQLLTMPPLAHTAVIVGCGVIIVLAVLRLAYPSLLRDMIKLARR